MVAVLPYGIVTVISIVTVKRMDKNGVVNWPKTSGYTDLRFFVIHHGSHQEV